MKHSEYYSSPEYWPQPPDEPCTLAPSDHAGTGRRKEKSSGRMRRKMSESLAGVTAAALAVVMVAASIPKLSHIADDIIPILPDLPVFQPTQSCPVCGAQDCSYFADGFPGLRLSFDNTPVVVESDDFLSIVGYSSDLDYYYKRDPLYIFTNEGERLVLQCQNEVMMAMPMLDFQTGYLNGNHEPYSQHEGTVFTGLMWYGDDDKTPYQVNYIHAVIAYDPSGDVPLVTPEMLQEYGNQLEHIPREPNYVVREIPGVPNAQLQICSNLETVESEFLLNYIEAVAIDGPQTVDLGQTMRLAETGQVCRVFNDFSFGSSTYYHGFHIGSEDQFRSFCYDFNGSQYSVRSGYDTLDLVFFDMGWNVLFDRWMELNRQAPGTGHEVNYPLNKLNSLTVNGIVYDCYLAYSAYPIDDVNGNQWAWVYLVPQQEQALAIIDQRSVSPEELQYLLEQGIDSENSNLQLLDCITLR